MEVERIGEAGEEGLELGVQGKEDERAGDGGGEGLHGGGGVGWWVTVFWGLVENALFFRNLYLN